MNIIAVALWSDSLWLFVINYLLYGLLISLSFYGSLLLYIMGLQVRYPPIIIGYITKHKINQVTVCKQLQNISSVVEVFYCYKL